MKLFSNKRVQSSRHLSDLDGQFSQLSWEVQVLPSCTSGKAVFFGTMLGVHVHVPIW